MACARPLSRFLHVLFILVLANLAACGGGGGGSSPTGPSGNNGNGASASDVVTATAYQFSADGHVQATAAGVTANLVEVDAGGTPVRLIAGTQTAAGGTFSFDLKASGATRSPRLWVQIAAGTDTYRAPLVDGGEVGPHTEAASRYVIERIQARGLPLADPQSTFGSALWSAARIVLDGSGTAPDMATYATYARQALDDEQQLQGWLSAYSASGTLPVLDVGNFFGFAAGNNWTYHHTTGSQIQSAGPTKRRQDSASGDIYVEALASTYQGATALIFTTKDSETSAWPTDSESYAITAKGFTQTGTQTQTDADRLFANIVFPLPEIPLPLRPTARTILSEKTTADTQLDVDDDNKQDAITVRNELIVQPGGRIAIAAGEFDTVLVERIGTYLWKASGGKTLTETHTLKEWRAPNLGVIRRVDEWAYTSTIDNTSGSSSEILELQRGRVGQVYYPGRVHASSYTLPQGLIGVGANGLMITANASTVTTYSARTGQLNGSFALPADPGQTSWRTELSADGSKLYFASSRAYHLTQDISGVSAYNARLHRFDVASGTQDFDLALPDMPPMIDSTGNSSPVVWARNAVAGILINPADPADVVIEAYGLLRLKGEIFLPQIVPGSPTAPYSTTDHYEPIAWVEGQNAVVVRDIYGAAYGVIPTTANGLSLDNPASAEGVTLRQNGNRMLSRYSGGSFSILAQSSGAPCQLKGGRLVCFENGNIVFRSADTEAVTGTLSINWPSAYVPTSPQSSSAWQLSDTEFLVTGDFHKAFVSYYNAGTTDYTLIRLGRH